MGLYGRIHVAKADGFSEEYVDNSVEGPPDRGVLRDIRLIGDHVYVTGMKRQVYRRESPSIWSRQDRGVVIPTVDNIVAGFNSIDGFSENNIYAVGWSGEIWHYDGKIWQDVASPTNIKLERIICVDPDKVYICGQAGILIKGNHNRFKVIDHNSTRDDFGVWNGLIIHYGLQQPMQSSD